MKEFIDKINSLKLIQIEYYEDIAFPEEIQKVLDLCTEVL